MIYLDANASALPVESTTGLMAGNPSSAHRTGQAARAAIETARESLAQNLGVSPGRLVFTSGGSESLMTALWSPSPDIRPLYLTTTDHPAARKCAQLLERRGLRQVRLMAADGCARPIVPDSARQSTAIVSLQVAHSELGTVLSPQWIRDRFGEPGTRPGILHLDCCQALGKIEIQPYLALADMASFSAHKMGAMPGTGLLYIREGLSSMEPLIPGEQEWRRRGGTENSAGILSMAGVARQRLQPDFIKVQTAIWRNLTAKLRSALRAQLPDVEIVSPPLDHDTLPQTTFFRLPGLRSNYAVIALDKRGIAVSAGTACRSGLIGANETALALGYDEQAAAEMIRVSLDWDARAEQIDALIAALISLRTAGKA